MSDALVMTHSLLVTRPQPQANEWVDRLRALGVTAQPLPLLRIAPLADDARLSQALAAQPDGLVFVSPNAVSQFFANVASDWTWPSGVFAAGPGPGTAAALRAAGVPDAALIAPDVGAPAYDAATLWTLLQARDWTGKRVLIVQGQGGRADLQGWLSGAGAQVDTVVVYLREGAVLDAPQREALHAAMQSPTAHTWLFASAQSLQTLEREAPGASWADARALATHPRIAQALRDFGFGHVDCVSTGVEAVAAAMAAQGAAYN